jgi:cytoskeletal protein CcmA (bactofilin family)
MLQPTQNGSPQKFTSNPTPYTPPKNVTVPMEQATIGRSLVIKGEVSGSESLYIDGRVEGTIRLEDSRLTVGRNGVVVANISAKEVVIMGTVTGNIQCTDRLDIRSEGSLIGDVATPRICVEDGAMVKGAVEVRHADKGADKKPSEIEKVVEAPKAMAAAASASPARSATLTPGSKVMYNESN